MPFTHAETCILAFASCEMAVRLREEHTAMHGSFKKTALGNSQTSEKSLDAEFDFTLMRVCRRIFLSRGLRDAAERKPDRDYQPSRTIDQYVIYAIGV